MLVYCDIQDENTRLSFLYGGCVLVPQPDLADICIVKSPPTLDPSKTYVLVGDHRYQENTWCDWILTEQDFNTPAILLAYIRVWHRRVYSVEHVIKVKHNVLLAPRSYMLATENGVVNLHQRSCSILQTLTRGGIIPKTGFAIKSSAVRNAIYALNKKAGMILVKSVYGKGYTIA